MWVFAISILIASLAISSSCYAFGQQSYTQLFKDKFTESRTVPLPTDPDVYIPPNIKPLEYNLSYAEVVYESPTTIVFRGDLIIVPQEMGTSSILNTRIWEALDFLKKDGFHLIQVLTTGEGNKGNPHTLYVAMEK